MPKKIQEAFTSLKLIKKFGLVGGFTPKLDETVVPVVVTDDLSAGEDWRYAFISDLRPAVALEFNTWELANPIGSGKVIQLLEASFLDWTGQARWTVHVNDVSVHLPGALAPQWQDLYEIVLAADEFPAALVNADGLLANMPGPEVFGLGPLPDTKAIFVPRGMLLYPGVRVFFQENVVEHIGEINLQWRERPQRPDGT